MKAKRTDPVLNRPSQGQDSREFLKNLEDLMKRNKGGFGAMAFDVGSNKPYRVGGRVQPVGKDTPSLQWQLPPVPQPPELIPQNFENAGDLNGQVLGASLSDNPTPNEMLQAIFNEAWTPQLPTTEQLYQRFLDTGEAFPVASMQDGTVRYSDGSIRQLDQSTPPMPIASMADGNILWSDGFTRQSPPGGLSQYLAGVSGLSQFIFGQEQTVTQPFGNYNPTMGYTGGMHSGVDYRTRDYQGDLYAPVPMRVVQVISAESGSPYGNSVLLELPSGEMIRLSHLSKMPEFTDRQVLNPGDLIGTPGSTGNSTGEHLDVEYYNQQGQLDNPNNFKQNVAQYSIANQITGVSPYQTQTQQQSQVTQPNQTQTPLSSAAGSVVNQVSQLPNQISSAVNQVAEPVKQTTASAINQLNPTGNFDLGITESLQGNPEASKQVLSQTIADTGNKLNLPEMQVSEAAQSGGLTGALRQLAGNVVDVASTPLKKIGLPDTGVSEAIAGGPTVNTGANFIPANAMEGGNQSRVPTRQDYGQVLGASTDNVIQQAQAKAGQGIEAIKGAGQGIKNLIQTGIDKLTPRRVVGDQSGSIAQEVGDTAQKVATQPKNDIRDPFFKMGGAQLYSKYVAPNAEQQKGGALSLDLFSPDFFQNPDNVANVFGSTSMGEAATSKYKASEANKYPLSSFSPMSYGDTADSNFKSAVDNYNREGSKQTNQYNQSILDYLGSIPSVLKSTFSFKDTPKPTSPRLSFGSITKTDAAPNMSYAVNPQMNFNRNTPQMSVAPSSKMTAVPQMSFARSNAPKPNIAPKMSLAKPQQRLSLDDYLRMGKTAAQWYAETGQQSTMDSMRSSGQWNDSGKPMSVGPQQGVTNAINAAASGQTYVSPSGNAIPNYSPANANMTDASTGLPVVGKPSVYAIASLANGKTLYSDGSVR